MSDSCSAEFRFAGVLNRFRAPAWRGRPRWFAFDGGPAVKDPIEAQGVPHTEVGRVVVDGREVTLSHRLVGDERVEVFPVFDPDAPCPDRPPAPAGAPRFVLDVHLGRLAGYLRLLGFDTVYDRDADDDALLERAGADGRRLLTRDTGLLKRTRGQQGAFVYATDPLRQVREAVDRFGLAARLAPFSRCAGCNGVVRAVAPDAVRAFVPADVAAREAAFTRCDDCGRVYWRGSHPARLKARFAAVGIGI